MERRAFIKMRFYEYPSNKFYYDVDDMFKNPSVKPSELLSGNDSYIKMDFYAYEKEEFTGKEIYQGDIVEALVDIPSSPNYHGNNKQSYKIYGLVVFDHRGFGILNLKKGKGRNNWHRKQMGSIGQNYIHTFKIIGNQYQNPELVNPELPKPEYLGDDDGYYADNYIGL